MESISCFDVYKKKVHVRTVQHGFDTIDAM